MSARVEGLKALDPKTVLSVAKLISGDGWTIFKASAFVEAGMPVDLVMEFVSEEVSDRSDPKSTITKNGKVLDSLIGVYGLDLIESMAYTLVPKYECDKMGRGFRAAEASSALKRHFGRVGVMKDAIETAYPEVLRKNRKGK